MKTIIIILTATILLNINAYAHNEVTLKNENSVETTQNEKITTNKNNTLIVVKNMLGEVLYSKVEVEEFGNILVVNDEMSKLPKGIYVIVATSNNQIFKKKIMIK